MRRLRPYILSAFCLLWLALSGCSGGGDGGTGTTPEGSGSSGSTTYANTLSTLFDGANKRVSASKIGDILASSPVSNFSVAFWLRFSTAPSTWDGIVGNVSDNSWADGFGFYFESATGIAFFVNNFNNRATHVGLNTDTWYHIAGTYDRAAANQNIKIYVNGTLQGSSDHSNTLDEPNASLTAGRLGNEASAVYIDELAIWDDTLPSAQVSAVYNAGEPFDLTTDANGYVYSTNLRTYLRMGDGDSHPTVTDNKGSFDGTMDQMSASDFVSVTP